MDTTQLTLNDQWVNKEIMGLVKYSHNHKVSHKYFIRWFSRIVLDSQNDAKNNTEQSVIKDDRWLSMVARSCNSRYLAGGEWEDNSVRSV
jgi:hypothetical protein